MKLFYQTITLYFISQLFFYTILVNTKESMKDIIPLSIYIGQTAITYFLYRRNKEKFLIINVNRRSYMRMSIVVTLIFVFYMIAANGFVTYFFPEQGIQGQMDRMVDMISVIVFIPMIEEIIFRGILFDQISENLSFFYGNLLQAFIFGLFHMSLYIFIFAFTFGIVLGVIKKYMSLFFSILAHSLYNLYTLNPITLQKNAPGYLYLMIGVIFALLVMITIYKWIDYDKLVQ